MNATFLSQISVLPFEIQALGCMRDDWELALYLSACPPPDRTALCALHVCSTSDHHHRLISWTAWATAPPCGPEGSS